MLAGIADGLIAGIADYLNHNVFHLYVLLVALVAAAKTLVINVPRGKSLDHESKKVDCPMECSW